MKHPSSAILWVRQVFRVLVQVLQPLLLCWISFDRLFRSPRSSSSRARRKDGPRVEGPFLSWRCLGAFFRGLPTARLLKQLRYPPVVPQQWNSIQGVGHPCLSLSSFPLPYFWALQRSDTERTPGPSVSGPRGDLESSQDPGGAVAHSDGARSAWSPGTNSNGRRVTSPTACGWTAAADLEFFPTKESLEYQCVCICWGPTYEFMHLPWRRWLSGQGPHPSRACQAVGSVSGGLKKPPYG